MTHRISRSLSEIGIVNGLPKLHTACAEGQMETLTRLLAHGERTPGLNARCGPYQWTPLHFATKYEKIDAVQALVDAKAMVGVRDGEGRSALDWLQRKRIISEEGRKGQKANQRHPGAAKKIEAILLAAGGVAPEPEPPS